MNTSNEDEEFIRLINLCKKFDCDRRTMERLIDALSESHEIQVITWNGQKRVNYKQFKRAVVQNALICF